jgi:glycosyltransferase involved in cell wall biosynthesis
MEKLSEKPLVSVIIPLYNSELYIKETVESVFAQTYPNIEIILVDDGSTDGTKNVVQPYIDKKLVTYIYQTNKGLPGARNTGIRNSRGPYVAYLDSDDVFFPEKIERQVAYLEAHPRCGVCYCGIWHFYDGKPDQLFKLDYTYYSDDEVFPHLLLKNFVNPLSVVMRRSEIERVGLFDESYLHGEDWEYWVRLAYHGTVFEYLPDMLAKYRMWKGGKWYGPAVRVLDKQMVVRDFKNLRSIMTPAERKRYHMNAIIFRHTIRLWYAEIERQFPMFAEFHKQVQKKRLGVASS